MKERADEESMFDCLTKSLASNIETEQLEYALTTLVESNLVINKKTPTGLSFFRIVGDSWDSRNEVKNLTGNNHDDLNLNFNENYSLLHYNIDTPYSHQVVSRPNKAAGELKLEGRLTASIKYIEHDISSLNYKFQHVCDKLKTVNIPEYKVLTTSRKNWILIKQSSFKRCYNQNG